MAAGWKFTNGGGLLGGRVCLGEGVFAMGLALREASKEEKLPQTAASQL